MDAAHGRETGVWEGIWLWTSVAFWEGRRVEGSCARHRLAPSSLRRLSTILAFMVTAMRSVKLSTPRADRSENHNLGHPRPPPPLLLLSLWTPSPSLGFFPSYFCPSTSLNCSSLSPLLVGSPPSSPPPHTPSSSRFPEDAVRLWCQQVLCNLWVQSQRQSGLLRGRNM